MSREIKRVPLDFEHEGAWPGYIRECDNANCDGCPDCARQEPPTGDGWQVWESVSEGSPVSPVLASRDAVVAWLVANEDCAPAAADKFVEDGYAPSMIGTPFGIFMGVQMAAGVEVAIEWQHTKAGDYSTIAPDAPIRHLESGITGKVNHRFPPPQGEYYLVTWDRGLPSLLAEHPDDDPEAPMTAGCRVDGFEVVAPADTGAVA
jgi:hypothetical protein